MKNRLYYYIYYIFIIFFVFTACKTTRYVPEDKYLLNDNKLKVKGKGVKKEELKKYIRHKPNQKTLGLKLRLALYSLSDKDKKKWPHNWLQKIGEQPVIYDSSIVEKTNRRFELYLKNQGYYHAEVRDTVLKDKQKANVKYYIRLNEPYIIKSINYHFEDSSLRKWILPDTVNSLVSRGDPFSVDVLDEERERISRELSKKGYFDFNKQYVYYEVDSSLNQNAVNLTIGIKKYVLKKADGEIEKINHIPYKISKVYIMPYYRAKEALTQKGEYFQGFDTTAHESVYFVSNQGLNNNKEIVYQSVFIDPGDIYNSQNVEQTYNHLSSIQLYKIVNITFNKLPGWRNVSDRDTALLNCQIQLTPANSQAYSVEVEGTNSSGNLGGAASISYKHKNLLNGYEVFDLRLRGAFETLKQVDKAGLDNTHELGAETRLNIQKFLLPIRSEAFIQKYNPRTMFTLAYNYQRRPDYSRTITNFRFGYHWKGSDYVRHTLNPLELNSVDLPYVTEDFKSEIAGTYLEYSYQPHSIAVSNYQYVFNNQDIRKRDDYVFLRFRAESAGNIPTGINKLLSNDDPDYYRLFGVRYSQYVRGDLDFRYYQPIYNGNKLAYRFFAGGGYPYGNSFAMPFEKQYFSGGANSLRAWQVRSLGPGSYQKEEDAAFPNQTGDIKLEANIEYRFPLVWILEGALFLDAGNVWSVNKQDERVGARFQLNDFYRDIAVGTGFGTRFDFSFFLIRLDIGMKLRNPALQQAAGWIPLQRSYNFNKDFNFAIGIGYPF